MNRVVVFGAGSIGRGFVGASFAEAGWRITFVDIVESLIERLNADGAYNQLVASTDGERVNRVAPVDAVWLGDVDGVVAAVADADFAATAVGAANLPGVADLIADGMARRLAEGRGPLDVLLCENLHDAADVVRNQISARIGADGAAQIGLAATSIGRMVPVPVPNPDDPTQVRVEPYSFLPYDAAALLGEEPAVPDLVPVRDGFAMYGDRKLYVHNMGHCMLAYLGEFRAHEFLWQAVGDLDLRYLARSAMVETATALSIVYGTPMPPLLAHVDDLLSRFTNRALGDTVERVGRDPQRKMRSDDRFLGAYSLCLKAGVAPQYVSLAVALGARRLAGEEGWDATSVRAYLDEHLFADGDEARVALFEGQAASLAGGLDVAALVAQIDASFLPSRIV